MNIDYIYDAEHEQELNFEREYLERLHLEEYDSTLCIECGRPRRFTDFQEEQLNLCSVCFASQYI